MKERFETTLKAVAKEEISEEEQLSIKTIEKFVDADTMEHIREIQSEKLDLVQELKEWRKKFWNTDDKPESKLEDQNGARKLSMTEDGEYQVYLKGGEAIKLTKGEVMSASEWGYWWKFDDSVPQVDQIAIMSKQVRNVIAGKYDEQLVEFGSVNKLSDDRKRDTYKAIGERNLKLETMPPGILAEKMITSLLIKEMHDNPNLSFIIKSVDVYEDVEHKIDFVLELHDLNRGVKVNADRRVGIQFTTNPFAKEKKEKQIEQVRKSSLRETDVDELVLVTVPLEDVVARFEEWSSAGKKHLDPRGPDHLWPEETKETIIKGLVEGIGLK